MSKHKGKRVVVHKSRKVIKDTTNDVPNMTGRKASRINWGSGLTRGTMPKRKDGDET